MTGGGDQVGMVRSLLGCRVFVLTPDPTHHHNRISGGRISGGLGLGLGLGVGVPVMETGVPSDGQEAGELVEAGLDPAGDEWQEGGGRGGLFGGGAGLCLVGEDGEDDR